MALVGPISSTMSLCSMVPSTDGEWRQIERLEHFLMQNDENIFYLSINLL